MDKNSKINPIIDADSSLKDVNFPKLLIKIFSYPILKLDTKVEYGVEREREREIVTPLDGWSVCDNLLKGQEVTLPCSCGGARCLRTT